MNSVSRNSMILAVGTAASRISGMVRTIALVAALGTTGIAANAYQAGAQIPQIILNLLSTGLLTTVLMPQIVRTFKDPNSEEKLNKLITLALLLLGAVTIGMMFGAGLLTQLYVDSSWTPAQLALAQSFTLWCVPQIFFYGLYVLLGQILAAKNRFGAYAWSSVGANVISTIGFVIFIIMFGNVSGQPPEYWDNTRLMLTAGCWTLGVAFQALILFVPISRLHIHYRPQFGLRGIGLRSMSSVAMWTIAIVVVDQIVGIIGTNIMTAAPVIGKDLTHIAGNATFMNVYQIIMIPYSLITVSMSTAVFPRISQYVVEDNLPSARREISNMLRSTSVFIGFFMAFFLSAPTLVMKALLPSATSEGFAVMYPVFVVMSITIFLMSASTLLQKAFYAFEDGFHPFIFTLIAIGGQPIICFALSALLNYDPRYWTVSFVGAGGISMFLGTLYMIVALRKRCGGDFGIKGVVLVHGKVAVAGVLAGGLVFGLQYVIRPIFHVEHYLDFVSLRWITVLGLCAVLGTIFSIVYFGICVALRISEVAVLLPRILRLLRLGSLADRIERNAGVVDNGSVGVELADDADVIGADDNNLVSQAMADEVGEYDFDGESMVAGSSAEAEISALQGLECDQEIVSRETPRTLRYVHHIHDYDVFNQATQGQSSLSPYIMTGEFAAQYSAYSTLHSHQRNRKPVGDNHAADDADSSEQSSTAQKSAQQGRSVMSNSRHISTPFSKNRNNNS